MTFPRSPSATIAVDANILISAVLGSSTGDHLDTIAARLGLVTSEGAFDETRRVVAQIRPEDLFVVDRLALLLTILPTETISPDLMVSAEVALRNAPASRNGSTTDAHLLALAWTAGSDLWSHDRGFAGAGWPSWSTENLLAASRSMVPESA